MMGKLLKMGLGMRLSMSLSLGMVLLLSACSEQSYKSTSRWDSYYADQNAPRAHVVVVPPLGTTLPMAKLIAASVVDHLSTRKISAEVGNDQAGPGRHFILTGVVEDINEGAYQRIIRWSLADSLGRLIASHSEGINSTDQEWAYGSARVLASVGISTAGPVAQMVLAETNAWVKVDALRKGLLVERIDGISPENASSLKSQLRQFLRKGDVSVTGDIRQAAYKLVGDVKVTSGPVGFDTVRVVWRVLSLEGDELGRAVQENKVPMGAMQNQWDTISPLIAKAAAVGVEYVFGGRSGPLPGAENRATGAPPAIVLPGVVGRALPPPQ